MHYGPIWMVIGSQNCTQFLDVKKSDVSIIAITAILVFTVKYGHCSHYRHQGHYSQNWHQSQLYLIQLLLPRYKCTSSQLLISFKLLSSFFLIYHPLLYNQWVQLTIWETLFSIFFKFSDTILYTATCTFKFLLYIFEYSICYCLLSLNILHS